MLLPSFRSFEPLKTKKCFLTLFFSTVLKLFCSKIKSHYLIFRQHLLQVLVDWFGCRCNKNKKTEAAQKTDIEEK
jgi:hypothetical protein